MKINRKLLTFFITLFASALITLGVATDKDVRRIRVVWHEDPAHEAYIMWTTLNFFGKEKSTVYYDTVSHGGDLSQYRFKKKAKDERPAFFWRDVIHSAKIKNLEPSTTYYIVVKTAEAQSKEYHFVTAPRSGAEDFKLLFGGDSRSDRAKRREINRKIGQMFSDDSSILALVHGGDYILNGASYSQWWKWFHDHFTLTTTKEGRLLPIVPTRGNHEISQPMFNKVFAYPGDGKNYFRTKIGELSIITLDTNSSMAGDQKDWLEQELVSAMGESKWIVANYHEPAWPGVKKPGGAKQHFVPLFEKYHVDLVFESDGHSLKKTVPIYNDKKDMDKGIIYIGEGGLGVKLREAKNKDEWYLQSPGYADSKYHVLVLDVQAHEMAVTVDLMNGQFYDQFSLYPKERSNLVYGYDEPLVVNAR